MWNMQTRLLGRTGESLSVVGLGAIVFLEEDEKFARETVARAVDAGVNYFDMGPYGDGMAEKLGGPALGAYRDRIFVAEKTAERTRAKASELLRQSLKNMRMDYFDLYQLHGVQTLEEVDTIFGPGGAMEAFVEARDRGLVRHFGFSAHSEEAALALMSRFDFDSILFPINYICWYQGNFGPPVVKVAREKGMGILALKTLAYTGWPDGKKEKWLKPWYKPVDAYDQAKTALRWTLSRPVTSCVCPSHAEHLWWMIDAEKDLVPLTEDEELAVARSTEGVTPIFPIQPAVV